MDEKIKTLTIRDPFSFAFLLSLYPTLEYKISVLNGRAVLEVQPDEKVYRALNLFARGELTDVAEFSALVRRIKSELITARKQYERTTNGDTIEVVSRGRGLK